MEINPALASDARAPTHTHIYILRGYLAFYISQMVVHVVTVNFRENPSKDEGKQQWLIILLSKFRMCDNILRTFEL